MLFDRGIKLVPLSVVAETTDLVGRAASEMLARSLETMTVAAALLYAVPPTSFVGAILAAFYLGGAIASDVRIASPLVIDVLFGFLLFGFCLALMVSGGAWLRAARLCQLLPFNTSTK